MEEMSASRSFALSTVLFFVITAVSVVVLGLVVVGGYLAVRLVVESSQPEDYEVSRDPNAAPGELATEQPLSSDGEDLLAGVSAEEQGAISELVDPAWVAEVSEATGIPSRALAAYAGADAHLRQTQNCSVGWNTLAGIGFVESRHGTLQGGTIEADGVARPEIIGIALDGTTTALIWDTDDGVLDGDPEYDRAVGPMQFIPETWNRWGVDGSGDGVASPHQIDDAALTAASYLCRSRSGLEDSSSWIAAIRSYNDSVEYQNQVAEAASRYAAEASAEG